ncbi:TetR/AcrR family transcriptional regulator [Streptomyces liangshanensis]|uniref:Helix-turn-helix transcriptional regulator n=1 Tax=Streptomyces liangshanensis TaxID=2717324 RepID=A0A6G9GTJ0_9ACTN|nr:TetR/AcrR family transcriptional regulator [Streptomyces liangshanensis]QIQ01257.1 helix-turn-helix transcriptional regulator [Streptomyces liangshanensis]
MKAYKSPRRAEGAAATHAAIIQAATELFLSRGYDDVTVSDIARAAGVAPQTVYSSAGGKSAILGAIIAPAIQGSVARQSLLAVSESEDPSEIIDIVAAGTRMAHEQHWTVLYGLLHRGPAEPSAGAVLDKGMSAYLLALEKVADRLVSLTGVRSDLGPGDVVDLLWFYLGQGAWFALVGERGWEFGRAEEWLAASAKRAILA